MIEFRLFRFLRSVSLCLLSLILILFQLATNANSAQVTLAWDPNTEPDVAGYKIYYGLLSGQYSDSVDVGNQTSCTLSNLQDGNTYYLAATTYDIEGYESDFSNEVVFNAPANPPRIDFDGDGKADIAIYRSSNGGWYIKPSSGAAPYGVGWGGGASDIPVPGDYDGDGKTDVAIYRASNGGWYIIPSSAPSAPYGVGWGGTTYTPVPGDFNGDGKTDIAVYQASNGAWYIFPSGGGSPYGVGWGGDASDVPVITNPGTYM